MFSEVSKFSVIALTGRTGSGCSTAARILTSEKLPLPETGASHFQGNEARKYRIIKDYIDNKWYPFQWLQIKSIITKFILELTFKSFSELVIKTLKDNTPEKEIRDHLKKNKTKYDDMHKNISEFIKLDEKNSDDLEKNA